jgi:hypothetical protein
MSVGLLTAVGLLAIVALLPHVAPGRATPAGETPRLRLYPGEPPADESGWHVQDVPDLVAAERLLDHLEAHGVQERQLVLNGEAFQVRWRWKKVQG